MKLRLRSLLLTLFAIILASVSAFSQTATIATDALDYPPGSTAIITGSGFQPGETVTLQVLHDPTGGDDATSLAHQPWMVVADASGNVSSSWLVPGDADELGATLKLMADGQRSGLHAEWVFTDATGISNLAIEAQNPATIMYGTGGTATYASSMKVTGNPSNVTVTFSFAPLLPSGVTANSITINGNSNSLNFDLILNISTTTPATSGTYTVTATTSDGHSTQSSTNALSLIIGKATPSVTVTPVGTYTYSGSPQGPGAATNTGTGTSYTFSYSGTDNANNSYGPSATKPTNAGSYTVTATVAASADGNYTSASSSATAFTIDRATPSVT
ncbi:hypothetical protein FW778_21010, partial [Ginsengibacter hankyongi]